MFRMQTDNLHIVLECNLFNKFISSLITQVIIKQRKGSESEDRLLKEQKNDLFPFIKLIDFDRLRNKFRKTI